MTNESAVPFTAGLPTTVLPEPPGQAEGALARAWSQPPEQQKAAVAKVAAEHPKLLAAWATLAEMTADNTEAYAYARVGYHRGLDALRGAGWRGSGYVRWEQPSNRGFLRALDQLRARAEAIGEVEEAERCRLFLHQLDPDWDRRDQG